MLRFTDERLYLWLEMTDMSLTEVQRYILISCIQRYDVRQFRLFLKDWNIPKTKSFLEYEADMREEMARMYDAGIIKD